ncbi:MAG: glycosyltransferase family 2 protein [Cytophagaceae bacterium]
MSAPKVLISVLNWNSCANTLALLTSIKDLKFKNYLILVIDNNSSEEDKKKLNDITAENIEVILLNENYGFAGGHSIAVEYMFNNNYELIWLLNNDVTIFPDTLSELVQAYNKYGQGLYGSISVYKDHNIEFAGGHELVNNNPSYEQNNIWEGKNYYDVRDSISERKVLNIHGSSMLIPASVIKKHGFIDTSYFLYGEEYDYCINLFKNQIYSYLIPSSVIFHMGRGSSAINQKLKIIASYYQKRNSILNKHKHWSLSKYEAIKKNGGIIKTCYYILKSLVIAYVFPLKKKSVLTAYDYNRYLFFYDQIALWHFFLGRKGKTCKPENYL